MKLSDFEMLKTESPNGVQAVLDFGKYHLSVIRNEVSYGNRSGLYEIAAFDACDGVASGMTELPGVTAEGDTVKGFLTESDVDTILKKMYLITGQEPVQI